MAATKGGWPGFVKNGTTPSGYQQCSAPRDGGKSPSDGAGDAVLAADKSVAPREFGKSGGGGGDAVLAGDKGEYPRSFPKSGYDGSQPCENQLNKTASKGKS